MGCGDVCVCVGGGGGGVEGGRGHSEIFFKMSSAEFFTQYAKR